MTRIAYPTETQWSQREDPAYGPCEVCGIMGNRAEFTIGGCYPHYVSALLCPECADLPVEQALRLGRRVGTVPV